MELMKGTFAGNNNMLHFGKLAGALVEIEIDEPAAGQIEPRMQLLSLLGRKNPGLQEPLKQAISNNR